MEEKTTKGIDEVTRTLLSFPVSKKTFLNTTFIDQVIIPEPTHLGTCYMISMDGKDTSQKRPIAFCFRKDDARNFLHSQTYEINFLLKERSFSFNQIDIALIGLWIPKIERIESAENESLHVEQGIWESAYAMPGSPGIRNGELLALCDNKERANRVARTYQSQARHTPIIAYYIKNPETKVVEFSLIPNQNQPQ